jgi:hypothetical protein
LLIQMKRMNREATKIRRKKELQASSRLHKEALSKELNTSFDRLTDFSKNMLVIGGVLFTGYTILDRLLEAKLSTSKKSSRPGKLDSLNRIILPMLAMALQQGSMVLLKKARIMLVEYLEEKNAHDV